MGGANNTAPWGEQTTQHRGGSKQHSTVGGANNTAPWGEQTTQHRGGSKQHSTVGGANNTAPWEEQTTQHSLWEEQTTQHSLWEEQTTQHCGRNKQHSTVGGTNNEAPWGEQTQHSLWEEQKQKPWEEQTTQHRGGSKHSTHCGRSKHRNHGRSKQHSTHCGRSKQHHPSCGRSRHSTHCGRSKQHSTVGGANTETVGGANNTALIVGGANTETVGGANNTALIVGGANNSTLAVGGANTALIVGGANNTALWEEQTTQHRGGSKQHSTHCGMSKQHSTVGGANSTVEVKGTYIILCHNYFARSHEGKYPCPYERHCTTIKQAFSKRWHPQSCRYDYHKAFSINVWEQLSQIQKSKHSLAKCDECFKSFYHLQNSFPLKPVYNSESSFAIDLPDTMDEKSFVEFSTEQLDNECTQRYGHSYVDSLIKCKKVAKRKTKSQQVKENRELLRKCRDAVNTDLYKTVPLTILDGDESVSAHNRKRLAQYFEPAPPNKKKKTSHSPNFYNVE